MKVMEYGSEYDWQANLAFLTDGDTGFVKPDWQLYRSGRDAMKALARIAGRKKVLLPALCCESMILPFEKNGYSVEFYKLREELRADMEDVERKLEKGCVLLYMRYYGIPAFEEEYLRSIRGRGEDILFVEDRTHDILLPREKEGFVPDAVVASLRKWAALPEGGVLTTELGFGGGERDSRYAEMRREAMEKKSRYLENWDAELKKACYRELGAAERILDEGSAPVKMGAEEERLLRSMDFESLYRRRAENVRLFKLLLMPLAEAGKLRFVSDAPENSSIYFPVYLENNRQVQAALAEKGIYSAVLWPIPSQAEGLCPVTEYVVGHILGIPCDQRCSEADVRFMAETLGEILGDS